ncbi:alpha/beta fold hydrolase [Salinarimonas ramus]|nr:alpha/beta fold hydrolase [Salinarimonas ramus]
MISRRTRRSALALASLLAFCLPAAAQPVIDPAEVGIVRVPCTVFSPPDDPALCLLAWLPMSWDAVDANGRVPEGTPRIAVHLTVLSNPTGNGEPNPVVVLSGGPGQAASDAIETWGPALAFRRTRSVILVDQRGTGRSLPRLGCSEIPVAAIDGNRFNDPGLAEPDDIGARLAGCREAMVREGIDVAAFDTRAAALDLAAIRSALDLPRWNLVGTSYGARLALEAMRVDPQGIRSVVLNSPLSVSPDHNSDLATERVRLVEALVSACAADPACAETYGDLGERLARIRARLDEAPLQASFRDPGTGAPVTTEIVWADVVAMVAGKLATIPSARTLPRAIAALDAALRGRVSLSDRELAEIFDAGDESLFDGLAVGLHLSVRCREDTPFADAEALARAVGDGTWFVGGTPGDVYDEACSAWDVPAATAPAEPVESTIPTLILTGDADPLTPTAWAHGIAAGLENAQLLTFRGQAHDLLGALGCARVMAANFIDAPEETLDAACVGEIRPIFE